MKRRAEFGFALVAALAVALPLHAVESKWVQTGVTGRLINVPDAEGDRIMDFSGVGYKGRGLSLIPNNVPNVVTLSPVAGDDTTQIQNAINQVAAMSMGADGFRGAVLLSAGDYDINTQLNIGASGIVLRGVGDALNQTVIHGRGTTQRTLVNIIGSGSQSLVSGTKRNMIDKTVPAGATSFRVDSTSGLAVGDTVRVERPSTDNWIHDVGMDVPIDGDDEAWQPNGMNIRYDRTVTRIEGNRIFLDAPLANSFESQYGGGTIQKYTWTGRIQDVGVENLRAQSDFASNTDENHAWTFVSVENAQNVWVRHATSQYFGKSAVLSNPTAKWVAVDDVVSLDPKSTVDGERRYTFDLSGQLEFVGNSQSDSGRHDFVNNSTRPPGPHVFYNSTATNALNDSGPHQRWATGTLYDNITVQGDQINAKNNGSLGTLHGWSASNVVIWNSHADGFTVQNPPTSQNWLIGSTGAIVNDTQFGVQPAGYVDSHGTPVTAGGSNSLYDAQFNDSADIRTFHWNGTSGTWTDALAWDKAVAPGVYRVSSRDYLVGDIDNYTNDGTSSVDNAYVDPAWKTAIQSSSALPVTGLDDLGPNHNVAFTVQHTLDAGERVVHGYLALGMKQAAGNEVATDFVRLFDMAANHRVNFSDVGWDSQINSTSTFVGAIDMGPFLDQMQSGNVNVQVNDDTGLDWAMYVATVATPKSDPTGPSVFLDRGGLATVNSTLSPVRALNLGGSGAGNLKFQGVGAVEVREAYTQLANGTLTLELSGSTPAGILKIDDDASLAGSLVVQLASGFNPVLNNTFTLLSGVGDIGGTFNTTNLPALGSGLAWKLVYNPHSVLLQVVASIPGDYNGDNVVDARDYVVWRDTFGSITDLRANGDDTGLSMGVVDQADFDFWKSHFGQPGSGGIAGQQVPEPTSVWLLVAGAAALILYFRRCA